MVLYFCSFTGRTAEEAVALAERDEEQEGEQVEPWLRAPKPGGRGVLGTTGTFNSG